MPWGFSRAGRWREKAAATSIRPLAAPVPAVGARLRLAERHQLVFILPEYVADAVHGHFLTRDGEAVARPAAPLAHSVSKSAAVDPKIMCGRKRTDRQHSTNQTKKSDRPQSHGSTSGLQRGTFPGVPGPAYRLLSRTLAPSRCGRCDRERGVELHTRADVRECGRVHPRRAKEIAHGEITRDARCANSLETPVSGPTRSYPF